jgi:hypothetical protein
MLLSKWNIDTIIADKGIERFIDNTKKVIKMYAKNKWIKENNLIVKRYAKLLLKLQQMKDDLDNGII